ncbi:hypothetical protein NQ315_009094 [Exocentrus adspersus]|uniref:FYVE-type domain-containing protein n=1 Tax=Exocentrus adspersus TaxID=1586481 RepID=A0AAV8WGA5_9CUCU|nr:hypothetical protein NQ315_009094 [Exocentrus adspersus]
MDEILIGIENLLKIEHGEKTKMQTWFYRIFCKYGFDNENEIYLREYILPKIQQLYDRHVLRKDILYLTLIAYSNIGVLKQCIEYDKYVYKLRTRDACSLSDYSIFKGKHWIYECLTTYNEITESFNENVSQRILSLKIIGCTNDLKISLGEVVTLLKSIDITYLDTFWSFYIKNVNYLMKIVDFCKDSASSLDVDEVFYYALEHSTLEAFSKYLDIPKLQWEEMLHTINEEEDLHHNDNLQSRHFLSFFVLGNVFKLILPTGNIMEVNINELLYDLKLKILSIKNLSLQVEILENIFVILFVKSDHIVENNLESRFICNEKQIRLILYFLKMVMDDIKLLNAFNKKSEEFVKFNTLNKSVADAIWRIELIENVKEQRKYETNLLRYMLAPPESLIYMCIKRADFKRAQQVLEIFGFKKTFISAEIECIEKFQLLRKELKRYFKLCDVQKGDTKTSVPSTESVLITMVENFFKSYTTPFNHEAEQFVTDKSKEKKFLDHLKYENEAFMDTFDLAITQPKNVEHCSSLIRLAFDKRNLDKDTYSSYNTFCTKLHNLWKEIGYNKKLTLSDIIISPYHSLDLTVYKNEEDFYVNLAELYKEFNSNMNIDENGFLNSNHPSHKSFLKLDLMCNKFVELSRENEDNVKYLEKLYTYLKAFSKVFYIEQDSSEIVSKGKNVSYFNLLYHNRSGLMGKLLFERHLDPTEFEKYFGKLKLDYLYHVIGNCFPTINLHSQENVSKEELYPENNIYTPSKSIITYILKRNWLLAFILSEMHKIEDVKIDVGEVRVQSFLRYMKLPRVQNLKVLFDDNEITTALQNEISIQKVSHYIDAKILKSDYLTSSQYSQNSNDSFEAAQEILEDVIKSTNWKELYDIVDSIPANQLRKASVLTHLKDMILMNLVQDRFEINYFKYVQFISDKDVRLSTILCNLKQWPGNFCIDVIKSEITKFESVQGTHITELKMWLHQIQLCEELKSILEVQNWFKAFEICHDDPAKVISKLILADNKIHPLLEFIRLYKPNEDLLVKIDENYFTTIFGTCDCYTPIKTLLDNLPYNHSLKICYNLLKVLRDLDHLQFVVNYLLNNVNYDLLKNIQISLKMLSGFAQIEQEQMLCLIQDPLSIIEVLVMNTKLDKLSTVLDIIKSEVTFIEFTENKQFIEDIDEVLRRYAEKSLDFRVITQPNPRLLRSPEYKLMQSIDSLSLCSENRGFVMPDEVPTKEEWVPNNEVLDCMCCRKIVFSMFNRRHHCRRCGRVVCYNCSTHRMLIPTYADILVRVCEDCYRLTVGESTTSELTDTVSTKSVIYDYWLLTDDPEHNKIVREEFSFEHAPSVSLCLSVMKYHSKSIKYPKFLLDQCEIMLKLLQPSQEPIQEVDYLLVIKMLKSLAIAAKMMSVECNLTYGTSSADRILSQAELLGLLAERGCLSLLPVSTTQRSLFIDASVIRKLRDRLLEREQWNLALEVSTKTGLDVTGVFAAWGKSCLKAGSLVLAREKFQKCFEKTGHYDSISDTNSSEFDMSQDSLDRTRTISKTSHLSAVPESKPPKNPPFLNEIIYILESKTISVSPEVIKQVQEQRFVGFSLSSSQNLTNVSQMDAPMCIINKLRNLQNIANGNYYQFVENNKLNIHHTPPSIDNMFYNECVYYLTRYGTHQSLLEFYIKHGDIAKALNYIIDNQLSAEIFIDIYIQCLKDGIINILQEHMLSIDPSLTLWKEYLQNICRHLEKHNMLHSLYQLQQFMGDFVRAAMTCIRFYQDNVKCFSDLLANASFLQKAEEYLRAVLVQDQWVEVASVGRQSTASGNSYEEKSLTNPSLVMKMTSQEINKCIDTIWRQKEVVTFLAGCEVSNVKPMDVLCGILQIEDTSSLLGGKHIKIPTLFGTAQEKIQLAVLTIICGNNVDDGFNIALGIIQDFKLKPAKVYCEAGKQLAKSTQYSAIGQLVNCIKHSSSIKDDAITDMCDEMLTHAVATFTKANVTGAKVEDLIRLISDRGTKISAYIEAKQLKTAYFLAVKYKRMSDIRRILREADLLNQPSIKALCQKVLLSHSHSSTH